MQRNLDVFWWDSATFRCSGWWVSFFSSKSELDSRNSQLQVCGMTFLTSYSLTIVDQLFAYRLSVCDSVTAISPKRLDGFRSNFTVMTGLWSSFAVRKMVAIATVVAKRGPKNMHFWHFLTFKSYLLLQFSSDQADFWIWYTWMEYLKSLEPFFLIKVFVT